MVKVAILDDYQGVALTMADWRALPEAELTVFREHMASVEEAATQLQPFEAVCVMRERMRFPRELFARLPNLRLVVTTGGGNAVIDLAAAQEHGVTVCGTRGTLWSTPELTWGLIFAAVRNIPRADAALRAGAWQTVAPGMELHGRTLGLLGLGRIGAAVTKVALAFGMEVIAWSQNLTDERAREVGARRVEKDDLLRMADILSIHLVLSGRTRGLVGAHELGLMQSTAYLVNTSRGPIVDEAALVAVLRGGRIAGAGLDVYDHEPLPADHPLRQLDNVVLTPHIGYVTEATYRLFYGDTVKDIRAWLDGAPVRVIAAPGSN